MVNKGEIGMVMVLGDDEDDEDEEEVKVMMERRQSRQKMWGEVILK